MPVIRTILNGGLNLDDSPHIMQQGSYVDALNITRDADESLSDISITNIVSNRIVNYSLPSGTNICIGAKDDVIRNSVYYFVWNSNNYDGIYKYDNSARTVSKLLVNLTDTGGIDILKFGRYNKIVHIDIVHNDDNGDLVYWTVGTNPPRKINVSKIQTYVPVTEDIINAAKNAPKTPLLCEYKDDANVNVNNLRNSLFQFAYSWCYDDGEESTLSPLSKVALPVGGYEPDTANNPTKNNNIKVTLNAGGKDCSSIKLYVRSSLGVTWSDYMLVDDFKLSEYNIPDYGTYDFYFYNDNAYPFQDPIKTGLNYTWLPDFAKAQVLANGTNLVYGAITEGWNNMQRSDVDVIISSGTGSSGSPSISGILNSNNTITITIGETVTNGTVYTIRIGYDIFGVVQPDKEFSVTATTGETNDDIVQDFLTVIAVDGTFDASPTTGGIMTIEVSHTSGAGYNFNSVTTSESSNGTENADGSWKWTGKYRFGLIYFNDLMKPVSIVSFTGATTDATDFVVNTSDLSVSGSSINVPFINASINHLPPEGATSYQWLRTDNLNAQNFLYWITNDYETDADYLYLCIQNLIYQHQQNSGFVPSYEFKKGDHVRVIAKYDSGTITPYSSQLDFEILGTKVMTMSSPAVDGLYLKVKKPNTLPTPAYDNLMFIEIYTPALHDTDSSVVLYEWGEKYDIYEDVGVKYHRGQVNDQTALQPATFKWFQGDVYTKYRNQYLNVNNTTTVSVFTMDANFNDYFVSEVNSNGRAWALEPDAKITYYPTRVRFGQTYFTDGFTNGMNLFYYDDMDNYNRSYGDIVRLFIKGSYMKVGQKYKIGNVPILLQMIKDISGDNTLAVSDKLINQIFYYSEDMGAGESPESWASYGDAIYGCDTYKGIIWRLSLDGLTPLSYLYKVNSWATDHIPLRTGNYKIYGIYNNKTNRFISALEATDTEPAYTIVFDESQNQFESFLSLHPEMMCMLGTTLMSFNNGNIYTHDANTYNNFFGVDYESNISPVFNPAPDIKKGWNSIAQVSNVVWDCPLIYTNVKSYGTQRQESSIPEAAFKVLEGMPSSSIYRDKNSSGGLINGQFMKGNYCIIKLRKQNASALSYISEVSVSFIQSQLNLIQ